MIRTRLLLALIALSWLSPLTTADPPPGTAP
jgi:hypothetical protein